MAALVVAIAVFFALGAAAQKLPGSQSSASSAAPAGPHNWITPASSVARPEDAGHRVHTNYVFASANGQIVKAATPGVGNMVTLGNSL